MCYYQDLRRIALLVIHCSATREDRNFPVEALRRCHVEERGFADIGYHFYITRDGLTHRCRPLDHIGAHARGFNDHSIGICYEGGLDTHGRPADTRTVEQKIALIALLRELHRDYPDAYIRGHYELSADIHKACPCFNASEEYAEFQPDAPDVDDLETEEIELETDKESELEANEEIELETDKEIKLEANEESKLEADKESETADAEGKAEEAERKAADAERKAEEAADAERKAEEAEEAERKAAEAADEERREEKPREARVDNLQRKAR